MNYIELINRFWQEVEMADFNPLEGFVYFRLLDICNRKGWQNPFSLPNVQVVGLMAMDERKFRAMRDKLAGRGLVQFRAGERRKSAPMYCFPEKRDEGWMFPWPGVLPQFLGANNDPKIDPKIEPKLDPKLDPKTAAYNKTKTKTKNNISPNGDEAVAAQAVLPLDFEDKKKRKRAATPKDPPPFPTLEEVFRYFLSQDADKRLRDWEQVARKFFDNFNAVDWLDIFNRRITRWDSRANKWILDEEERQKSQPRTHETDKTDRFQQRRGTLPTAQSGEDYSDSL